MKIVDSYTIFGCIFFLLFEGTSAQTTQCNAEEYMSVVLNLEALRVQFKELKAAFDELKLTDIANLQAKDVDLQENIDNLETNMNTEVANLTAVDASLKSMIDELKDTEVPSLQARDVALDGRINTANTNIESLQTLTQGHTTSITQLSDKDTDLESSINSNTQTLTTLTAASAALSSRINALEAAMSSPVAFHAASSDVNNNYVQSGNGIPLVLNKVVFESSQGLYDPATGKFTAPQTGYYVFTFTVTVTKTDDYGLIVRLATYYGRTDYFAQTSAIVPEGSNAVAATGTAILLISQGTQVWVDTHNTGEVRIHACWFSGWLHQKN